mmetsp:Transcript_9357/g.15402  ORF Transcript_9357/g.15402 Transcript_9357/m.15402 type:complete len:215 (+) Transcript_9357:1111-1755(+)
MAASTGDVARSNWSFASPAASLTSEVVTPGVSSTIMLSHGDDRCELDGDSPIVVPNSGTLALPSAEALGGFNASLPLRTSIARLTTLSAKPSPPLRTCISRLTTLTFSNSSISERLDRRRFSSSVLRRGTVASMTLMLWWLLVDLSAFEGREEAIFGPLPRHSSFIMKFISLKEDEDDDDFLKRLELCIDEDDDEEQETVEVVLTRVEIELELL